MALVAALLLAGCASPPPEQALRDTIAALQEAAEARDSDAIGEHLADDFAGPGNMDREQFRRMLAVLWLRNRNVGVSVGPLDVQLLEQHATVRFSAVATGGEGLIPDRAEAWQVTTGWRLVDGEWKLISADWE